MGETVFLLGAGASVDAGMPTVKDLTRQLRDELPHLTDVNGKSSPEFSEAFAAIAAEDSSIEENYERFFEWMGLLLRAQQDPFRRLIKTDLGSEHVKSLAHLSFVVGEAIARLLESRRACPAYLAKMAEMAPSGGRLRVFTLNYDCCLEDACEKAGIPLTTGFDARGRWSHALLRARTAGISVYKLHGSLRWYSLNEAPKGRTARGCRIVENKLNSTRGDKQDGNDAPQLVLGPGSKIQADDPFLTLFYEFHLAMARARACVVVGYGYRDEHINKVLDQAASRGVPMLDVNPGEPCLRYMANEYRHLKVGAKQGFISGLILAEMAKLAK